MKITKFFSFKNILIYLAIIGILWISPDKLFPQRAVRSLNPTTTIAQRPPPLDLFLLLKKTPNQKF